jgi:hypothetical protein
MKMKTVMESQTDKIMTVKNVWDISRHFSSVRNE